MESAHAIAWLLLVAAACVASPVDAVSGYINVTAQLWDGKDLVGNSSRFTSTNKYYDGSTPLAFDIPDLAPYVYAIPETPGQLFTPSVGDSARSLEVTVGCRDVEDGTCMELASLVTVRLYNFPTYKDNGGRSRDFSMAFCVNFTLTQPAGPCNNSWTQLIGVDRTVSALSILVNNTEYIPGDRKPPVPPSRPSRSPSPPRMPSPSGLPDRPPSPNSPPVPPAPPPSPPGSPGDECTMCVAFTVKEDTTIGDASVPPLPTNETCAALSRSLADISTGFTCKGLTPYSILVCADGMLPLNDTCTTKSTVPYIVQLIGGIGYGNFLQCNMMLSLSTSCGCYYAWNSVQCGVYFDGTRPPRPPPRRPSSPIKPSPPSLPPPSPPSLPPPSLPFPPRPNVPSPPSAPPPSSPQPSPPQRPPRPPSPPPRTPRRPIPPRIQVGRH